MGYQYGNYRICSKFNINRFLLFILGIVYLGMILYQNKYITVGDISSFIIYTINLT